MKQSLLTRVIVILAIYLGLYYFGGIWGRKILYPVRLLVTFLHEFGHALGAIISGGSVENLQINANGSGFARTVGGSRSIILMGGYLGSAIFGNILFLIAARAKPLIHPVLVILALGMLYAAIFWFNSMFTTGFLVFSAIVIFLIIWKTNLAREVLMFFGLASILYIIQDFNVGPTSDLEKYAEIMKVLPASVWMYIWLAVALILFAWNLKIIFNSKEM